MLSIKSDGRRGGGLTWYVIAAIADSLNTNSLGLIVPIAA
jgi:hypothetical protein